MKLDKHVVDMFTELTKPADDVKMEKTCYGTISVVDGTRYVKLDGSDLLVPAASTVKTSHGDRVTVLMKNHSLTVTGNLTAPATDGGGGSSGEAGTAATIEVGTVTTGEAGSSASVTNSGTTSAAVFDFVIPRGDKGEKGEKGDTGPQGPQGEAGTAATIKVGRVTTVEGAILASVTNSGTTSAAVFDFVIPRGEKGEKGEKGDTGTWDGTIPDHEHTVSDITDFPTSLPANGGNADTVDGHHASDFSQIINLGHTSTDTKNALGIQYQTTAYWCFNWTDYPAEIYDGQGMIIAAHYNSYGTTVGVDNIWCRQIFISPHPNTKIYQRIIADTDVGEWTSISDGGNADTLDGKHASDFAQMRGDIADCNDAVAFGTYNIVPETKNAPTANYYHLVVEPAASGTWIKQTAVLCDSTASFIHSYTRININGAWSGWTNNADTLDGLHANEIASNPNLLINPDFRINQRGISSPTAAFGVDRWMGTYTVSDNTIVFSQTEQYMVQSIENIDSLIGREVTATVYYDDGTADKGTAAISDTTYFFATSRMHCLVYAENGIKGLEIWAAAPCNIVGVKLELGSIATPFVPPDPATELAKCQRYYQIRSTGNIPAVDLRPSMRTTPTVTQLSDGNYAYSAEL